MWAELFTLTVATELSSDVTFTVAPGGDTLKLTVVAPSLGAPFMLVWDSVRDLSHLEVMLKCRR